MAKLKIKNEHGKEWVHELVDDTTTIGRASDNTIKIADEKASRHHFRLEKQPDNRFKVLDLGSTNGTRLNGTKINEEACLKPGDQLSLGETTFTYEDAEQAAALAAAAAAEPAGPAAGVKTSELETVKPEKPAEPAEPKYVLKMIEGKTPGTIFELGLKTLTIGRHNSSTIQIVDDAASNYHAEINREPIGYVLTDLGSTNGTRVCARNKTEFEKIVKTPLAVGMQIRIGKTLLEFNNIGKPVADEALFGTLVLEPEKLGAKPRRGLSKAVLTVLALLVFGGVVFAVKYLLSPPTNVEPPIADKVPVNLIPNGDFAEGTNEAGSPKEFDVIRASPEIRVAVTPEAAHPTEPPVKGQLGLQVGKGGAKAPFALTVVETTDSFLVDAGKTYAYSGWLKNDGDGLYGLRVTWLSNDRQYSEYPLVRRETQEWKNKPVLLTPPPWAQRAKAGVFVQGKEGKACFDTLCFIEKPKEKLQPRPTIRCRDIELVFEDTKGVFAGEVRGQRMVENGMLLLAAPDSNIESDMPIAMQAQMTQEKETGQVVFKGEMYDPALGDATTYKLEAQAGAGSVDLHAAIDMPDRGCAPRLRFFVVGAAAQGEIEAALDGGGAARLGANEDKQLAGVRSLLFNAGKTPQLDVSFGKPAEVEIKREGSRRRIELKFNGELRFALAPESLVAKQEMAKAITDLEAALQNKKWGEAQGAAKKLSETFGARYPEAKEKCDKAQEKMNEAWSPVKDDLGRVADILKKSPTPEAVTAAKEIVNKYLFTWTGTDKEEELKNFRTLIDTADSDTQALQQEKRAAEKLASAQRQYDGKAYPVARAFINQILNNPELAKTPSADKARELLQLVDTKEAAQKKLEFLNAITTRLLEDIKVYEQVKEYKKAIDIILRDKEYQDNQRDLPDIETKLNQLHKNLGS